MSYVTLDDLAVEAEDRKFRRQHAANPRGWVDVVRAYARHHDQQIINGETVTSRLSTEDPRTQNVPKGEPMNIHPRNPVATIASMEAEIERLRDQANLLSSYGEDDWPEGTVLVFERKFGIAPVPSSCKTPDECDTRQSYIFAAVKAPHGRGWYLTGKMTHGMTWGDFLWYVTNDGRENTPLWRALNYEAVEA